jgi:hypothetical protein
MGGRLLVQRGSHPVVPAGRPAEAAREPRGLAEWRAVPGRATTVVSCPTEPNANVADSQSEWPGPDAPKITVDEDDAGKLAEGGPARPPERRFSLGTYPWAPTGPQLNMQEDRAGKWAGWLGPAASHRDWRSTQGFAFAGPSQRECRRKSQTVS